MSPARRSRTLTTAMAALALTGAALLVPPSGQAAPAAQTATITLDGTTTQSGRIFRDAVPSTCGAVKAYPTLFGGGTTYNYSTTTYVAPTTGCLTIVRSNSVCGGVGPDSGNVHLSVYESSYHPDHQSGHYLADQGASNNEETIGVDVVKGRTYVVVATNTTGQQNCTVDVTFTPAADATPPDTVITSGPGAKVRDSSTVLGFTGNPVSDTASFQCKVDAAAFAACASPLVLDGLTVGQHTVAVAAVDEFGNVDATPATRSFLSCDLATATLSLQKASVTLTKANKAVAKAKKAVAKAQGAKVKKAKKKLAKAAKAAKKAKAAVTGLQKGILACAR